MSLARTGKFMGSDNPRYGKHLSQELRERLSAISKGRRHTPEEIQKQIKSQIGHHISDETRRKISISNTGKTHSLETRLKISLIQKGKKLTEVHKQKLSLAFKGRKLKPETIEKIRIARLQQQLPVKDTAIEKILQTKLKEFGIEFETHKAIVGQPDIFIEPNICIFCDGDYWHGNPKLYNDNHVITKNQTALQIRQKDSEVNAILEAGGYKVMRFWEYDIRKESDRCVGSILDVINNE
jgi:DNA mismatch endonuclease Vsr